MYMDYRIVNNIKEAYSQANSRVIFIDYDGTLIPFSKYPEQAIMNGEAKKMITTLTNDPKNKVIIISGRNREFLEHQFIKVNVTLIAEHGFFIKEPHKIWETNLTIKLDWKQKVLPILQEMVDKCSGSFIEEKFASFAWHYRNVDNDFAEIRLPELKDSLWEILENNANLQLLEGIKVLEIKSMLYNKGTVAAKLLQESAFDFTMAVGDDVTDEDLFKALPGSAFSIKIGSGQSSAKFNLKKQEHLYDLFQALTAH